MSAQVGLFCYSDLLSAAKAACAGFTPVSSVGADGVRSVSCAGVDAFGGLQLSVAFTPTGGTTQYSTITQQPTYPDCVYSEYLEAFEIVFGVILAAVAIIYTAKNLLDFLNWSRTDT